MVGKIVWAWVLTIPVTAMLGYATRNLCALLQ